ncbi:MAG: IMP dehydrogenase, partial [Candidatus Muiribacteriota bacterium]
MKYCNDKFMQHYEYEALTFDDVSLMTKYSEILPSNTNLKTSFTKNIKLNIPFVSAAMDTVTGWKMAVAMAKNGGIGIVHKNMSIEEQANEIAKIKKFLNGYIENPVFFKKSDSIEYILNYKAQNEYNFSSFPVIDDKTGKLCGIITSHDFKFIKDSSEKVSNYMSTGLITGQKGIKFKQAYELMIKNRVGKLPVIDENNRLVGMFALTDIKSIVEKTISDMSVDLKHRLIAGAAISPFDYERIEALINNNVDVLVVDTAHGHSKGVLETIREIKKQYSNVEVIGGNIATAEAALALYEAGADGVKVGIGPGSICTTRVVAGVGVPQVTAVYNCAKALRNKIPVIADGGIR